jgi:hypothetical protein
MTKDQLIECLRDGGYCVCLPDSDKCITCQAADMLARLPDEPKVIRARGCVAHGVDNCVECNQLSENREVPSNN